MTKLLFIFKVSLKDASDDELLALIEKIRTLINGEMLSVINNYFNSHANTYGTNCLLVKILTISSGFIKK